MNHLTSTGPEDWVIILVHTILHFEESTQTIIQIKIRLWAELLLKKICFHDLNLFDGGSLAESLTFVFLK